MAIKLAPSNNPEEESKKLSSIALVCGIGSLLLWFLAIAGLGLGIRSAILSKRVNNTKNLAFSIVGALLSLLSLVRLRLLLRPTMMVMAALLRRLLPSSTLTLRRLVLTFTSERSQLPLPLS